MPCNLVLIANRELHNLNIAKIRLEFSRNTQADNLILTKGKINLSPSIDKQVLQKEEVS